jgi:hypothetical protein
MIKIEVYTNINYCGSLPWKSCSSGCYVDTDLRKRYLVTGIPNMWEVSMGCCHMIPQNNLCFTSKM